MTNAQQWLDSKYSLNERSKITYLNIEKEDLTGELNLAGFTNLHTFYCSNNQLTKLDLSNCPN